MKTSVAGGAPPINRRASVACRGRLRLSRGSARAGARNASAQESREAVLGAGGMRAGAIKCAATRKLTCSRLAFIETPGREIVTRKCTQARRARVMQIGFKGRTCRIYKCGPNARAASSLRRALFRGFYLSACFLAESKTRESIVGFAALFAR